VRAPAHAQRALHAALRACPVPPSGVSLARPTCTDGRRALLLCAACWAWCRLVPVRERRTTTSTLVGCTRLDRWALPALQRRPPLPCWLTAHCLVWQAVEQRPLDAWSPTCPSACERRGLHVRWGAPRRRQPRALCVRLVCCLSCVCPFERDPFVCSDRSRGRAVVLLSCGLRVRSAAAASASSPARTCARAQSPQPAEPRPPSLQLEPARPAGGPSAQSPASTAEHAPSPGQPAAGTHPPPVRGSAAAASRYNRARIYGILCVILKWYNCS